MFRRIRSRWLCFTLHRVYDGVLKSLVISCLISKYSLIFSFATSLHDSFTTRGCLECLFYSCLTIEETFLRSVSPFTALIFSTCAVFGWCFSQIDGIYLNLKVKLFFSIMNPKTYVRYVRKHTLCLTSLLNTSPGQVRHEQRISDSHQICCRLYILKVLELHSLGHVSKNCFTMAWNCGFRPHNTDSKHTCFDLIYADFL